MIIDFSPRGIATIVFKNLLLMSTIVFLAVADEETGGVEGTTQNAQNIFLFNAGAKHMDQHVPGVNIHDRQRKNVSSPAMDMNILDIHG